MNDAFVAKTPVDRPAARGGRSARRSCDRYPCDMCGSTLTNNQVGVVVAEVLETKPKARVTPCR